MKRGQKRISVMVLINMVPALSLAVTSASEYTYPFFKSGLLTLFCTLYMMFVDLSREKGRADRLGFQ